VQKLQANENKNKQIEYQKPERNPHNAGTHGASSANHWVDALQASFRRMRHNKMIH